MNGKFRKLRVRNRILKLQDVSNKRYRGATLVLDYILSRRRFREGRRRLDAPGSTASTGSQSANFTRTLMVNGLLRTYVVHVPPGFDPSQSLPLVIMLHGGDGNAQGAAKMTGLSPKADQAQFVVAYPNGTGQPGDTLFTWNAWTCCGYALDNNIDDVGFIRSMIDAIQQEYNIDPLRVYATGFSNGAMLTYRLGCELADKLAAIGVVSGALDTNTCQPANPLPVIIFHGTADQHILYNGGPPVKQLDNHPRVDNSVAFAVNFWVGENGCSSTPEHKEKANIAVDTYAQGCTQNTQVILYTIINGGHAWPGGQKDSPTGDTPVQDISATNQIWEFFSQHSR